jgi:5'-deoxynucleotidase YfbR-like HD superfamily hydrolase
MNKENAKERRIANFLFEVGTMRKLMRVHRQTLLTDDMSDSIASHSYRVALIGWHLAKAEKADPYKTVMMCLLHDMAEARSNDHNWVHKKYVKVFDEEIANEQLGTLPYPDLGELEAEYRKRESKESILAKDADLIDQILLLREYEWQGNKEAGIWLRGKSGQSHQNGNAQISRLKSGSAKKLARAIMEEDPSNWWNDLWTPTNR